MMAELRISEVILSQRKKLNLTQEELAAALGVSAQAVSNWERGGYPDITMLPNIANFFEITVDELIGNDEIGRDEDIKSFYDRVWKCESYEERKKLALEYYRKYPKQYGIMRDLIYILVEENELVADDDLPLLRELCKKIIDGCTDFGVRDYAVKVMCINGNDEEFNRWVAMCPVDYRNVQCEQLEERLWCRNQWDECRREHFFVNLDRMLFFINQDGRYRCIPERSEAHNDYMMRLIESFGDNGKIPDGWLGEYAFLELRYAAGLFGQGKNAEGYAALESAFEHTKEGCSLPKDKPRSLGCPGIFGDLHTAASNDYQVIDGNGTVRHAYIRVCSWGTVYFVLSAASGWEWFDGVRHEERFKEYVERARILAGIEPNDN